MKKFAVACAALSALGIALPSRAAFVANLLSHAPGSNVYTYDIRVTVDTPLETLFPGDSLTIYDVAPPPEIASASFNDDNFIPSFDNVGKTPAILGGAAGLHDDPALLNVSLTWNGIGPLAGGNIGQVLFQGVLTITTKGNYTDTRFGQSASSTTVDVPPFGTTPGLFRGDQAGIYITQVPAQAVPEPASLSALALGAAALLTRRKR